MEEDVTIEGFDRYTISRDGVITSKKYTIVDSRGKRYTQRIQIIKQTKNCKNDRIMICLRDNNGVRKTLYVHRLIAKAFIPNPHSKPDINHINGICTDNRVENLEWCTMKENAIHAERLKLRNHPSGTNHTSCKIRPEYLPVIEHLISQKRSLESIGRMFGVSGVQIGYIKRGHHWTQAI